MSDELGKLTYDALWKQWQEVNQQPTPSGYNDVISNPKVDKNYFLKPEDMTALLNAIDVYDLYMKPDYTPNLLDYPTSAFNIQNLLPLGVPSAIVQASEASKNPMYNIQSIDEQWKEVPKSEATYKPYFPQGIYEHETGHYFDATFNPYRNKGMLKTEGYPTSTDIQSREYHGQKAENVYKRFLKKKGLIK